MSTLSCIVCDCSLDSCMQMEEGANQPYKGTVFTSHGQYGSTIFDPMDGSYLEINICDACLAEKARTNYVLINKNESIRFVSDSYLWNGSEE